MLTFFLTFIVSEDHTYLAMISTALIWRNTVHLGCLKYEVCYWQKKKVTTFFISKGFFFFCCFLAIVHLWLMGFPRPPHTYHNKPVLCLLREHFTSSMMLNHKMVSKQPSILWFLISQTCSCLSSYRTVLRMRWTGTNAARSAICSSHLPSWLNRTTRVKHMLREYVLFWESSPAYLPPQVRLIRASFIHHN